MTRPLLERFTEKYTIDPNSGCWLWTAGLNPGGYGQFTNGRKQNHIFAHRLSYEIAKGPIPRGMDIDHLCRVRHCVNPDHLEPVTRSENVKRGLMPSINKARGAAQTHCKHGHEFTEENTARWKSNRETAPRSCRECSRIKHRRQYWEKKCSA